MMITINWISKPINAGFWTGLFLGHFHSACIDVSANFILRINRKFVAFPAPSGIS